MKSVLVGIFLFSGLMAFGGEPNLKGDFQQDAELVTFSVDGQFPALPKLDVLFVVDDSGSMVPHRRVLANHIGGLTEELARLGVSAHFGVLGTHLYGDTSGKLIGTPNFLSNQDSNFLRALQYRVNLRRSTGGMDSVFSPVLNALSHPDRVKENAGFYRKDAGLAIIFFTDTYDQSAISKWELAKFLVDLKNGNDKMISISSVLVPSNVKNCQRNGGGGDKGLPIKIEDLTYLLKGKIYNLCEIQKSTFSDIGIRISPKFPKSNYRPDPTALEIDLLIKPKDPTSIAVKWGTQTIAPGDKTGWTYDPQKNQVLLGEEIEWSFQPVSTMIEVSYKPL